MYFRLNSAVLRLGYVDFYGVSPIFPSDVLFFSTHYTPVLRVRLPNDDVMRVSKSSGTRPARLCKARAVPGVRRLCFSRRPERSFTTREHLSRAQTCKGKKVKRQKRG